MMTNSVVPIAKAASAKARIGGGSREVWTELMDRTIHYRRDC